MMENRIEALADRQFSWNMRPHDVTENVQLRKRMLPATRSTKIMLEIRRRLPRSCAANRGS